MNQIGAEIVIRGMVQGVGYRYFCYRRALNLGLAGWVKNDPDGSVFVLAEGDRSAVEALVDDLKVGPCGARVTALNTKWIPFTGQYQSFEVRIR
ncbi:MAG: acylphosphatase [Candidatus Zixiibacteriota bacterium]